MANDEGGQKAAGKLNKRKLEEAIELADELIRRSGEEKRFLEGVKDMLSPAWQRKWYRDCARLSESVESPTYQKDLTPPEDTKTSSDPSSLYRMISTLLDVKDFLKRRLDDLENDEAAKKAKDEEPKIEEVRLWIPEGVICKVKGKPGIRQDSAGHTAVWVYNNLTRGHKPSISGTCTFWFKDLRTVAAEVEKEEINLEDAVIPVNSILVFEPTDQKLCVSEFRGRLLIKQNGKDQSETPFKYEDPGPGKCLTKFVYHCVDRDSWPLDLDPS